MKDSGNKRGNAYVYSGIALGAVSAGLTYFLKNEANIQSYDLSSVVSMWVLPSVIFGGMSGAIAGGAFRGIYDFSRRIGRTVSERIKRSRLEQETEQID